MILKPFSHSWPFLVAYQPGEWRDFQAAEIFCRERFGPEGDQWRVCRIEGMGGILFKCREDAVLFWFSSNGA
jgi:hypothetical protein